MSLSRDLDGEMQRLPLDLDTADRLLAGMVPREDAPPGYEEVASLLNSLLVHNQDPTTPWEQTANSRASRYEISPPRRSSVHRLKLVGAVLAASLACTTGLAFAGSLPGAAQGVASSMLAKVGVTVPGPNENAGTHPSVRGTSSPDASIASDDAADDTDQGNDSGQGKGAEISELATTTALAGVEKGAAISTAASGGTSQAGQHGEASAEHGASSTGAESGAATADAASGGHSTAGADNAAAGQSHKP